MIRKTAIARAAAMALGMATIGVWVTPDAYAQSNTVGSIYGTVDAAAGAEVVIESKETGFRRSIKPDANGRYSFNAVPTGTYSVSLIRNGQVVSKQDGIEVRLSQGSEVSLGATQTVQIRASRIAKIDTSTATSAAVFTAKDLERLPVAGNVGAIIQLAPNTTSGDSRYGGSNAPSFGGAGASENAYYINGFPVTTLLTQVGFSQLPFNSIAQAQVLTGGYGAEFGRSTGGVVNIITKRGGNDWEVGGSISLEPKSLRSKEKDFYYEPNGTYANGQNFDGVIRQYNALNEQDRTTVSGYVSGPIVKDKLFFYGAVEQVKTNRDQIRALNTSPTYATQSLGRTESFQEIETTIPRYLLKLDWAITDNHSVEYTRISDKVKDDRKFFGFDYRNRQRDNVQNGGASYVNWGPTPVASQQGATVDILKYTGYLTDNLTVTALVGKTRTEHELNPLGYNPNAPLINANSVLPPGFTATNTQTQTSNILVPGAFDENKGTRFDVEWKLNSSHKIRAGIDYNTIKSKAGTSTPGGVQWLYGLTDPALQLDAQTQPTNSVAGNALGQQGYYVQRLVSSTGSTPTVDQQAQYIEDIWQVTKDVVLILGLRNEGFDNQNGDGKSYIKLDRQLAPRIAGVWDLNGDASSVLKGTFGRYHVPLPTNVAIRGAGSSLNAQQNYVYTGINAANGTPTGLTAISPFYSPNNELGQAKDPREVAAQDMKGNYQDELTLGIQQAIARGWTAGAKITYRSLKTAIDDHCDDRPFYAWADRNNIDASNWHYNCALFNPGIANTFTLDLDGDGRLETIRLSAADLGVPKVKRTYLALDFDLEHPFDGKWWGKVTYTYARNRGNTEGQLLSDIGQADVATTQAYDFPEFSINSDGPLPNERKHQVKIFGAYQLTEEFAFGGNVVFASGRPRSCIGNAPSPVNAASGNPFVPGVSPVTNYSGYGSAYFFCRGVASPRGALGHLSAEFTSSVNFKYTPSFVPGLTLKADVFNLFNRQVGTAVEERFNAAGGSSSVRTTYGQVQAYSTPRTVRLTVAYDKKF